MAMEIVSKKDAKARGLARYFTGRPCCREHLSERMVSNGQCVDCRNWHFQNWITVAENRAKHNVRTRRYAKSERGAETRIKRQALLRSKRAGRPKPDKCELCGRGGIIHFDHCHLTGKFRGWLCGRCNQAIGLAKEDPQLLRKLAEYVEDHSRMFPQGDWIGAEETRRLLRKDSTWEGIIRPQK